VLTDISKKKFHQHQNVAVNGLQQQLIKISFGLSTIL